MQEYNVTGMSCASCSARVEKAVSKLDGVTECCVNLLTESMTVNGEVSPDTVINAVKSAGYGAELKVANSFQKSESNVTENKASPMLIRLVFSVALLLVLMYFSMGHTMLKLPLPMFLNNNAAAIAIIELLLTTLIMVINQRFFISGFKAVLHRAPNMDTLVSMGSAVSFVYSCYILFLITDAVLNGDTLSANEYLHGLYFESSAMILTFISIGKTLEEFSKGKTTNALMSLLDLAPKTAQLFKDGKEITVLADELKVGDIFVLRSGSAVPADGVITEGNATVDESAVTGESIPVEKSVGDRLSQGVIISSGYVKCRVTDTAEDSTVSQIVKTVSNAAAGKAPVSRLADKVSGIFVPTVIAIAIVTAVIWLILGKSAGFAIARGVSVLVISCPCALGLATPVAIMVASGVAAKSGILFKTAATLENAGKVKTVVLDKTGTVTTGKPQITDIIPNEEFTENELLTFAAAVESLSEHPIAKAVVEGAEYRDIKILPAENFETFAGNGVKAVVGGKTVIGGKADFVLKSQTLNSDTVNTLDRLSDDSKTPILFSLDGAMAGIIAVADCKREDSASAVKALKKLGIRVVMLTGDRYRTALSVANDVGIEDVKAEVLPQQKADAVLQLRQGTAVAMVGDGINDAPALATADVGIAIGAGTDIAIDTADIVLMKSSLFDVASAISLSRVTLRNIRENLFWAFIYNIIGIPIAAGVFIYPLGLTLDPMFAAAAMSFSSVCVVLNSLRLNLFKPKYYKKKKESKIMEKTITISGMMCGHCSGRVKQCLEALDAVETADVSHETGKAVVKLRFDIQNDALKKAVEDQGYTVTDIS